ncbi:MAG: hypothetical protein J5858_13550, partial [Lentisphaeria bacterium]|nr:hypothetical protein [Lentisphaeria bacterium]
MASVQNSNGSWGSPETLKSGDTVALSSLALLTFFSHGETFQSKEFGDNIRRGCDFLVEIANTPNIEFTGKGFGHAILTYALAEGYAITGSLSLRNALEQRVKFIIAHQNKFGSFFRNYDNSTQVLPDDEQQNNPLLKEISAGEPGCDLSLLGWHIQALTAAKNSGVQVENLDRALTLALEALIKIHQADKGGFSQGINMKRFPANANMTPVGLLGLYFLDAGRSNPADRAERLLKKVKPPNWKSSGNFPLYRWYYQTQAMFQAEKGHGKRWQEWNENLKKELLKAQQSDGSWQMPEGDNSYRVRNQNDLAVYASCLCSLMLQVYYRYLPSYSIAENAASGKMADDFDLGTKGLISRLPEGADPLAAVILGVGEDDMSPVKFGEFNGLPDSNDAPLVEKEFRIYASLRSTIAVHTTEDWPQTLQSNQRIALFLDDLLPRNFKGHMSLLMAIIGSDKNASDYQQSLEVVLNGKRLLNSYLLRNKQLVDVVIPNDIMLPYGNILQIRNNGKAKLAFDAAELTAVNRVGKRLYLLTEKRSQLPAGLKKYFSTDSGPKMKFCPLSSHGENRQLLPEIKEYDRNQLYIGEYSAIGNECMGNDFHKHYLRQTAREIVDWIAGGGSGVKINSILNGGKFYDSLYQTEYPAAAALKQTAKLFEGSPRRLNSQIYPKHGEKPALFLSCAASYNAPGIATMVVAKRFPIPEETEIIALIPWSGETEIVIERGFFSKQSPFRNFATPLETEKKKITVKDNVFRLAGVFPELSVIRLFRSGVAKVTDYNRRWFNPQSSPASPPKAKYSSILKHLPSEVSKMKKYTVWEPGGFTSVFGRNVQCSVIPATEKKDQFNHFKLE